jgi:hypothetical protein
LWSSAGQINLARAFNRNPRTWNEIYFLLLFIVIILFYQSSFWAEKFPD